MAKVTVGLISGRHAIPVDQYIWSGPIDPTDVGDIKAINDYAFGWVEQHCNVGKANGYGINQAGYEDIEIFKGDQLIVYVTGLTVCTAAVIRACALWGVPLTLMHWDTIAQEYVAQEIF